MSIEQVLAVIASPLSVALFGWWIKAKLDRSEKAAASKEQASNMLMEIKVMSSHIARIEASLQGLPKMNEQLIILINENKTQWTRLDDYRDRIKELERSGRAN